MSAGPRISYVVGQWVRGDRFYGRRGLIGEILDGPRDCLWLLGTRRIGKTSLLKQLEMLTADEPERGYFPVFWDFQGTEDPRELGLDFQDALLDAEDRLAAAGLEISDLAHDDLFVALGRLRRKLRARGLKLLLLCDEVEELLKLRLQDPALLRKFRRALQSSADVRSVLASTIRLWDLAEDREDTSPFLLGFTPPLYLGPLEPREADALLQQSRLPPEERPGLEAPMIERLRRSCDNHPFLLQLLAKRYLESGDFEEAVERVAGDRTVSHFLSVDFELLSSLERRILVTLSHDVSAGESVSAADDGTSREAVDSDLDRRRLAKRLGRGRSEVSGAVLRLESLGLVRRGDSGRLEIPNGFFRRWLAELPGAPDDELDSLEATSFRRGGLPRVLEERYELRELAGEGGVGLVFRTWDRLLETWVALKLLRPEYAADPEVLERFRQEILLCRDLGHPNILRVYHLGETGSARYLIMQWVEGPSLARLLAERGALPPARVIELGGKLASALEAAHARRVLHRDLKPQNILLDPSGEPLVTDFGLARLLGSPGITSRGMFLGTPGYVSPEQAALGPLDERSDLYSLGVVLFEAATGSRPFHAETAAALLDMHRRTPAPDPRRLVPGLGDGLTALILRCLEKEPGRRYASAADLRRAFTSLRS